MNPLHDRLPHGPEALLVQSVFTRDADSARLGCRVPAQSPFRFRNDRGEFRAPIALLLDAAAQATAALQEAPAASSGLVALFEDCRLAAADFAADEALIVAIRTLRELPPLRYYGFEVSRAEGCEVLAAGTVVLRL